MENEIEITECVSLDALAECVELQREAFALPEVELSPVRHFVVSRNAGGFTLGAYLGGKLAGFVLSIPAFRRGERAFYSHMTGVRSEFQGLGIGAKLKWAQRERAMAEGVRFIKWTFEPIKARNAYFNLEKLGAQVREYQRNFYGIDYATAGPKIGLASDRLFAEWDLESEKVRMLANGGTYLDNRQPKARIEIPNDWNVLVASDPEAASTEQLRVRQEFESAFGEGLIASAFQRDSERPAYLLFGD